MAKQKRKLTGDQYALKQFMLRNKDRRRPSTILRQANCVIEEVGWSNGSLSVKGKVIPETEDIDGTDEQYRTGAVCAVGAINAAQLCTLKHEEIEGAEYYFADLLVKAADMRIADPEDNDSSWLVDYNDSQPRGKNGKRNVKRRITTLASRLRKLGF